MDVQTNIIHGRTNKGILQCRHIKTVAPVRHYCDVASDHCQHVTKQNKHITWVTYYLKNDKDQWLKRKERFSSHKRLIKAFRLDDKFNYIEEDNFICSYIYYDYHIHRGRVSR